MVHDSRGSLKLFRAESKEIILKSFTASKKTIIIERFLIRKIHWAWNNIIDGRKVKKTARKVRSPAFKVFGKASGGSSEN